MTIAVPALPGPVPQSTDPLNFDTRADATLGALPSVIAGMNAQNEENNALNVAINATDAAASVSANAALEAAAAAASSAGAQPWASGATYALGASAWSPLNGRSYRRTVAGAGTLDPSLDATNWRPIGLDMGTGLPKARPGIRLALTQTRSLDPRFTHTRASAGTCLGQKGDMLTLSAGQPRFAHNAAGECLGLLIEPARTNLLLNSATLATQSVTVTAAAHTLSFYGSGTVTLSGAADAVVVGAGVFPGYTALTFTPGAGTLTLTVSGTVQFASLELGGFATSWMPTTGSAATRPAENSVFVGADFNKAHRVGSGTFLVRLLLSGYAGANAPLVSLSDSSGNATNFLRPITLVSTNVRPSMSAGGVSQMLYNAAPAPVAGAVYCCAVSYQSDNVLSCLNGGAVVQDTSAVIPAFDRIQLLVSEAAYIVQDVIWWPQPLSAGELQAATLSN
jgi:hypothetical protein